MSLTRLAITVANPTDKLRRATIPEVLIDTGSELTWLPATVLQDLGILPEKNRRFLLADRRELIRPVGFAILAYQHFITIDEVVLAEPTDMLLLGAHTLEGFGLAVDPTNHQLITTPTIVATT